MALTNGLKRRALATYKALRRSQGYTMEAMVDELGNSILANPNAQQRNFLRGLMEDRRGQVASTITDIKTNAAARVGDHQAESVDLAAIITELS